MSAPPGGTVTFLFTDIEGSTRLLRRLGDGYAEVLARHDRVIRAACAENHGHQIDAQGDAHFLVFAQARDAVAAAAQMQRGLAGEAWPAGSDLRVRVGLHRATRRGATAGTSG